MKKQVGQSVLAVLLVVVMTCSVQAVIVVSGDPGTGNSWYQRFNYDTNSTKHDTDYVMRLSVKQISGDTLELPHPIRDNASPSPTSNAPAGWTYDTIFGSEVDAIKTASQNIQSVNFSVWFNGNYVNTSAKIEIDTVIWEWVKSSCQWQFVQDGCDKAVATSRPSPRLRSSRTRHVRHLVASRRIRPRPRLEKTQGLLSQFAI